MKLIVKSLALILFATALSALLILPIMWCWNYVMPDLFGLEQITWKKALALSMLSSMLFKSTSSNK